VGVTGAFLDHAEKIPKFLMETIAPKPTSGRYVLELIISLPDGWVDEVNAAMKRAARAF
jgi:hypothetical protein